MITWSFDFTTGRPAVLLTITRRDGIVERLTSATYAITIGDDTWTPMAGLQLGAYTQRTDGTLPSFGFKLTLPASGALDFSSVHRDKYNGADVVLSVVNAKNAGTPELNHRFKILGNVDYDMHGRASVELVSYFAIPRDILVRKFVMLCDVEFGDPQYCKVPTFPYSLGRHLQDVDRSESVTGRVESGSTVVSYGSFRRVQFATDGNPEDYANVYLECTTSGVTAVSAPSFSSVVGATTVDGSAVWTTRNAYARAVRIAAVGEDGHTLTLDRLPDPRASDVNYLKQASILFATGEYAGRRFMASLFDPTDNTIKVFLPCSYAAVNDWAEIAPECDHTETMCLNTFNNKLNNRGFNKQQGAKAQAQQLGYD